MFAAHTHMRYVLPNDVNQVSQHIWNSRLFAIWSISSNSCDKIHHSSDTFFYKIYKQNDVIITILNGCTCCSTTRFVFFSVNVADVVERGVSPEWLLNVRQIEQQLKASNFMCMTMQCISLLAVYRVLKEVNNQQRSRRTVVSKKRTAAWSKAKGRHMYFQCWLYRVSQIKWHHFTFLLVTN